MPTLIGASGNFVNAQEVVSSDEILEAAQTRALGVRKKTDSQNFATPETSPHVSLSTVTFDYDSDTLTPLAKRQLDEVAEVMKKLDSEARLRVEGHTDDAGSDEYNMDLSQRRAKSVKAYLVSQSIAAESVEPYGWGERRPSHSNATDAGRAQNRRVDFVFRERIDPNATSETRKLLQTNKSFLKPTFTASLSQTGSTLENDAITVLNEGDGFRMDIDILESCFVSIAYIDTAGAVTWLYPALDDSVPKGVWSYYPKSIRIPADPGEFFLLDGSKGREYVVIFSAQSPIEQADALVNAFNDLKHALNSPGEMIDARNALRTAYGPQDLELHVLDFEHR